MLHAPVPPWGLFNPAAAAYFAQGFPGAGVPEYGAMAPPPQKPDLRKAPEQLEREQRVQKRKQVSLCLTSS